MEREQSIGLIKKKLQAAADQQLPDFVKKYEADSRAGVQLLIGQARKRMQALEAEKQRIWELSRYEREYASAGYICGIDEVGRGPLAGPVVAGAVILPKDCSILYINDSDRKSVV